MRNSLTGRLLFLLLLLLLGGCATYKTVPADRTNAVLYQLPAGNPHIGFAPLFLVEEHYKPYNRIGTPKAVGTKDDHKIIIDPNTPTIYTAEQHFTTARGSYRNIIYRLNFQKVPFPHITAGSNGGLLVYLTLNEKDAPLLLTTLHTCGCYLAFIPFTSLPRDAWPKNWPAGKQTVFAETLPSFLDPPAEAKDISRLLIRLRSETHRVMDAEMAPADHLPELDTIRTLVQPMASLKKLEVSDGLVSFYYEDGFRKGYVKGSGKLLERLFMSWWAFDFLVGEDKELGPEEETGNVFYTSLKLWDRDESNIWDFPTFLKYWGWNL